MPETLRETRHRPGPGWELRGVFGRGLRCLKSLRRQAKPPEPTSGDLQSEPRIENPKAVTVCRLKAVTR